MKTLTDIFYDLIDAGYIYDEDENGHGMSYGEYAAVAGYLRDYIEEQVSQADSLESALDMYREIVTEGADDDARSFAALDDDETDIYIDWDYTDDGEMIYKCYNPDELPACIRPFWDAYEDEHRYDDYAA